MNANIQFGRRIRPTEVKDVQYNAIQILYNELSQNSKSSNITVGVEPYILMAFGLVANEKVVVNNVFQNIEEPLYYDGTPIELTATNNIVILAVAGIYNLETVTPLGTFTVIGYNAQAIDTNLNSSVAVINPNGPHSQLPNTFFSGVVGQTYSQDFYVGAVPFVFRAYGITTQTIELEALFQDKVATVIEDGVAVTMSALDTTLIVSIAGRYRLKLIGSSLDVVVANNPTTINYTDPFLKKGEKGDPGGGIQWITTSTNVVPALHQKGYLVDASSGLKEVVLPANAPQGFATAVNAHGGQVRIVTNGNLIDGLAAGDNLLLDPGNTVSLAARQIGLFEMLFGTLAPPAMDNIRYTHTQAAVLATWTVAHNLGRKPSVSLRTVGGAEFIGEVLHLSDNTLQIYLDSPLAGFAYLT